MVVVVVFLIYEVGGGGGGGRAGSRHGTPRNRRAFLEGSVACSKSPKNMHS